MTITDVLTAAMAIATVWLAIETRRMARAAARSIELEAQPALAFRGLGFDYAIVLEEKTEIQVPAIRPGLKLINPGKVRVTYSVEQFEVKIGGESVGGAEFDNTSAVVFPGEEVTFFYPWIMNPPDLHRLNNGHVAFVIKFWSQPDKTQVVSASAVFTIKNTVPVSWEWHFKSGPVYG